jgi:hypothetical protein
MTTLGFRTLNGGQGIQIDETYRNLALRAKGTVTASTAYDTSNRTATLQVAGNLPVLAYRCAAPCAMIGASRSGSTVTYQFLVAQNSPANIDWWVFDTPDFGMASGRIGLQTRNPVTNQVLYDSRMKYMRVLGVMAGSLANGFPSGPLSYAGTPAVVTGNVPFVYTSQVIGAPGGPPPYPWIDFTIYPMSAMSGQQVTWSQHQTDAHDHPASQTFNNPARQDTYNYLVIDVTGY